MIRVGLRCFNQFNCAQTKRLILKSIISVWLEYLNPLNCAKKGIILKSVVSTWLEYLNPFNWAQTTRLEMDSCTSY